MSLKIKNQTPTILKLVQKKRIELASHQVDAFLLGLLMSRVDLSGQFKEPLVGLIEKLLYLCLEKDLVQRSHCLHKHVEFEYLTKRAVDLWNRKKNSNIITKLSPRLLVSEDLGLR